MKQAELTSDDIREALRVCFDPELPVNIVDLGLVCGINVQRDADAPGMLPRYAVHVVLTMRSPDDEREPMLLAQVQNRLMGMEAVSHADVMISQEHSWTAERMTDAARSQLGLNRAAPQGLIQIQR